MTSFMNASRFISLRFFWGDGQFHCLLASDRCHLEAFFGLDPVIEFLGRLNWLVVDVGDDVASFQSGTVW